jgi:YegS/Rv2252/BmrU family lipid kinase
MKIALIANPYSGGWKGKRLIPRVEGKLKDHHIAYDLFRTEYHGHAFFLVKQLELEKYDGVVCLGGDGTNYEVLNGLLKFYGKDRIPPLGIIPVGRGNSFVQDLHIHTIEDAIAVLSRQNSRYVDACSFTHEEEHFYFVNMTGFGFVTDAARTAFQFKFLGRLSYVIGVLHRIIGLAFHRMELEIDGQVISGANCFVEFCNSKYTAGNMLMAPDAKIDDGLIDVIVAAPLSRTSLMCTFPKIFKGTHGDNPALDFYKARRVKVVTTPAKVLLPDGEIFGTTPTEINIHPKLIRYFS